MKMTSDPTPPKKTTAAKRRPYRMSARASGAENTRKRLLTAAWEEFAARPYEEVKLSEIAERAGVTVQTLHLRFGSKEDLFAASFVAWGMSVITTREEAPVGDVPGAVANLFGHYEAHGAAILRMLSEEERIPAVAEMTEAGRQYHRAWVGKIFAPQLEGLRGNARRRRIAALALATDVLAWRFLRQDYGLTRTEAERAVAETVVALSARPDERTDR
jgi:AcrR family transcriptional regulator